jgi:hypothetical protein
MRVITKVCTESVDPNKRRFCENKLVRVLVVLRVQLNIVVEKLNFQIFYLGTAKIFKVLYNFNRIVLYIAFTLV